MSNKILLIGLFLLAGHNALKAQKPVEFAAVDNVALKIPDSLTHSTRGIAKYVNANFSSATDKSRAIFIWLTKNIQYDVDNMFVINFYQDRNQVIDKVLTTRKGICQGYAELFHDIATQAHLQSYVVSGILRYMGIEVSTIVFQPMICKGLHLFQEPLQMR